MSKYIDRSKANDEIVRVLEHTDCKDEHIDSVLRAIENLPTIEVSEDNQVLYGTDHNCILTMFGECSYNETGCSDCAVAEKIRKALSVEVSEDCISREYLLSKVYDMDNDNLVVDLKDIENAPSVVPTTEQSSMVDIVTCEECKRCKKGLVIERRADEQETIVNLCNRTKPPTMVSLDFYCKDGERIEE